MSKKFITIIVILVALALGGFGYFLFFGQSKPATTPGDGGHGAFVPLGGDANNSTTGQNPTTDNGTGQDPGNSQPIQTPSLPRLRKLFSEPVAGEFASTTASSTTFRFVERATGHVFESKDTAPDLIKLSNTTIPKVYEAIWNKAGNGFYLRYPKEDDSIVTFYAQLLKSTASSNASGAEVTPNETRGTYLPANIQNLVVSPKGTQIFYMTSVPNASQGFIANLDGTKAKQVFDSPIKNWNVEWPEDDTLTFVTKPSGFSSGFMYSYKIKSATLTRITGQIKGLYAKMSRDAKYAVYSTAVANSAETHLINIKAGTDEKLPWKTLVDKCAWGTVDKQMLYCAVPAPLPNGVYPDSWYQGNVLFVDQIISFNAETGEVRTLANLNKMSSEFIDATNLTLDNKELYLSFINKKDLSLWTLRIDE